MAVPAKAAPVVLNQVVWEHEEKLVTSSRKPRIIINKMTQQVVEGMLPTLRSTLILKVPGALSQHTGSLELVV